MSMTFLSHLFVLEAGNLFSRLIDAQMERNFASGQSVPGISPDVDESVSPVLSSTVLLGTFVVT